MGSGAHIDVKDLVYRYLDSVHSRFVLRVPELTIRREEFFCLLGPSGCGKSTLLNILSGFITPTSGTICIDGCPITRPDPRYIQVFQEYGLFPWRNVLDNVAFGLEIRGDSRATRERCALDYIELVGLRGFENHFPQQLSGGMRQRVAIARALAVDPRILFMDEPFGALDAFTRFKLQEEISQIALTTKKTVVFVTHNIEEAVYLGDRVAILSSSPASLLTIKEISVARPRKRLDERLVAIERKIYQELGL